MKLPSTWCTMQWGRGVVMRIQSPDNLIVDGMPRHILDLRQVIHANNDGMEDEHVDERNENLPTQRPQREPNVPICM